MIDLIQHQTAGIGLASGVILLMLALCFLVGDRLRPTWGLRWIALAMTLSALRTLLAIFNPGWIGPHGYGLLAAGGLAALVVGLRRYLGRDEHPAAGEWLFVTGGWFLAMQAAQAAGLGPVAGPAASTLIYLYLAALCVPRLRPVAGQAHWLAAGALLLNPVLVVGVGLGVLQLDLLPLRSWASLALALVGLGLLMAGSGRLRLELQSELDARQRAEAALRALNESLEQRIYERTEELEGLVEGLESFNRMVSHDLRGPLGGLGGAAHLARQALDQGNAARADELLGLIGDEASRLGGLVTQLLVLARVSNAELALRDTPLDAVLSEALQTLALSEGPERIACVHREPLPVARVDEALIRQVFVNLVGNALKFAGLRGEPEVRVRRTPQGPAVVIEVRDNGPGFEPACAADLFQPFRRLHGREVEGHGIGLTIVRRIVERHGGRVWAEGRPGQGASFFFSLPVHPGRVLAR